MPRTARLLIDGGTYHVLARGNNGQRIFHDPADYQRYARLLATYKDEHGIKVYHVALMPNHVHLIVEAKVGCELSKAMLGLNLSYALFYRKQYQYRGHLWQGRFKSLLIDRDSYLLECGRYVELNPVRAGLTPTPGGYPWTSYLTYAEGRLNPLIDLDPLYETFGRTPRQRQAQYQRFIQEGMHRAPPKSFLQHRLLGSPTFIRNLETRLRISLTEKPRGRPRQSAGCPNEK